MLWWIPIAVAGMAALGVLTVVASTAAGRYQGQHVLTDPHEEWAAFAAEHERGSMILAEERHHEAWLPAPPVDPAPWLEQTMAELSPEALGDECAREGNEAFSRLMLDGQRAYEQEHPLPEVVLPDAGGWISGPRLDDPGPGDAAVEPPASSGPDQPMWEYRSDHPGVMAGRVFLPAVESAEAPPSRWLAEQLDIQRAWWDWQMEKVRIFA